MALLAENETRADVTFANGLSDLIQLARSTPVTHKGEGGRMPRSRAAGKPIEAPNQFLYLAGGIYFLAAAVRHAGIAAGAILALLSVGAAAVHFTVSALRSREKAS